MKRYGLIGKTLKHSFSKKYFQEKFNREGIEHCHYELFELENISDFPKLLSEYESDWAGLNVTIPYKKDVMAYLDELDENAQAIDAVNTVKRLPGGKLKGFNTDYSGFRNSLEEWNTDNQQALILGTGGASNAVRKVLKDKQVPYQMVSRTASNDRLSYDQLNESDVLLQEHQLIINTTPLGTFPDIDHKPNIPYHQLTKHHMLFDLVYNPEITSFMKEGLSVGAKVKNGYDMLVGQAEAAWKIWNEP